MHETIVAALARHACERPAKPALIAGRVRLSCGEAKDWVDHATGWLLAPGLRRGASVLGWLPNCAEWYLVPPLQALRDELRAQGLAPYKAPERILMLPSLPMVGDKVNRRELSAMAERLSKGRQPQGAEL